MKIKPLFAWYDLWVGAFWDRAKRKLYVLPLPCIGIVFELSECQRCDGMGFVFRQGSFFGWSLGYLPATCSECRGKKVVQLPTEPH